jgi:hypothetical protein
MTACTRCHPHDQARPTAIEAWRCLLADGVTTVVVHRGAYLNPAEANAVTDWLRARGATPVTTAREAEVLQVPAVSGSGVK